MLCRNPYVKRPNGKIGKKFDGTFVWEGVPFPCGQCLHCRINRRRVWTHRIMLERYKNVDACYVTLTYQDDWLPMTDDFQPTLCKRDVQLFLKRLRKQFPDVKIRYYACGEYGGQYGRPHYHFCLFGISPSALAPFVSDRPKYVPRTFLAGHLKAWEIVVDNMRHPLGNVYIGELNQFSAQYVAGYVTKKLTGLYKEVFNPETGEYEPPESRQREFTLMSLKPSIGLTALDDIVSMLQSPVGKKLLEVQNDAPTGLKHGNKTLPFGRFLSSKLREKLGISEDKHLDKFLMEMIHARDHAEEEGYINLTEYLLAVDDQKSRIVQARHKIFSKR